MTLVQTGAPQREQPSFRPSAIKSLFDEMVDTYGIASTLASLGYTRRWRAQCVAAARIRPGMTVCDLMAGTGEAWPAIIRRLEGAGRIVAVDFSAGMLEQAAQHASLARVAIDLLHEDVFHTSLPNASADCVVSTFGLKTCAPEQLPLLAREIARILKPGGTCSLIEISVPSAHWLSWPYLWYINHVIPAIARLLRGNPENYRMLGRYTEQFDSCATMATHMRQAGLEVESVAYLGGCASGIVGTRPGR